MITGAKSRGRPFGATEQGPAPRRLFVDDDHRTVASRHGSYMRRFSLRLRGKGTLGTPSPPPSGLPVSIPNMLAGERSPIPPSFIWLSFTSENSLRSLNERRCDRRRGIS